MSLILEASDKKNKKWKIRNADESGKFIVYFGDSKYEDYTEHGDDDRKDQYLSRHRSREDWSDPAAPGFWARWLLWNLPDLEESIEYLEKMLDVEIKLI